MSEAKQERCAVCEIVVQLEEACRGDACALEGRASAGRAAFRPRLSRGDGTEGRGDGLPRDEDPQHEGGRVMSGIWELLKRRNIGALAQSEFDFG